jgi:hypothetical protein
VTKSIFGTVFRTAEETPDRSVEFRSDDGKVHRVPPHHVRPNLRVGEFVEYHIVTAGGIPVKAELRLVARPRIPVAPTKTEDREVVVIEQPTADNGDCFVVEDSTGQRWSVSDASADGYFDVRDRATLTLARQGNSVRTEALRSTSRTSKPFPSSPGVIEVECRATRVWNGYRWMHLQEALDARSAEPSDVGHSMQAVRVGGGAYGGMGEYSVDLFLWRVAEGWLLDLSEEGEGCELFKTKKDAMIRVREIRATYRSREQFLKLMERMKGRPLTPQEQSFAIREAEALGEL